MLNKELLQQALDALRHSIPSRRPGEDAYCERGWGEHKAAITALRSALAAPMPEPAMYRVTAPIMFGRWIEVDAAQYAEYLSQGWQGQKLYAAAVTTADNAALRESIDELESLCSAKQSEIDALRKLYHSQTGRVKVLEDALRGVLPWVVTQEVACNGLKCREAVCMSCDSDSEANTQLACDAYAKASNALEQKL